MSDFTIPDYTGSDPEPGTLYVVSTPIGNLHDITLRALHILYRVNLVAAEDTRTTSNLLRYYGIEVPLLSLNARNERLRIPAILARLERGESVAVVSDAGTPGISDPAAQLIAETMAAGYEVSAVPGASSLMAALVSSGLRISSFVFEGFLPVKKRRRARLQRIAEEERAVVLFESPHRVRRTIKELAEACGDRRVAICRELTKKFEEIRQGSLEEIAEFLEEKAPRGEYVIVLDARRERKEERTHS